MHFSYFLNILNQIVKALIDRARSGNVMGHEELISLILLQDMGAYEELIDGVSQEADKLISEKHPEEELIHTRREELTLAWQTLKTNAEHREKLLENNHEIQQFNR